MHCRPLYHTLFFIRSFYFDEDAGDEQDPEDPDPWEPGGGNYCYDEYGQAYVCGTDPRVYLRRRDGEKRPEDLYKKATLAILEAGIKPMDLYNEAMRIAGYPEEVVEESSAGRTKTVRYYPAGYIRVTDNVTGAQLPVKNIMVKARRWFKRSMAYTDASGYFYINTGFRQKAKITLRYQNNRTVVRAISGLLKFWEYALPLEKEAGTFEKTNMQNINILHGYNSNPDTYMALQWAAAQSLNTLEDMYTYSAQNSLPTPYPYLTIWISSAITGSSNAPMLRAMGNAIAVPGYLNYLFPTASPPITTRVRKLVDNFLPDITVRLRNSAGSTPNSDELSRTFFKRYANSQHFYKLNSNSYWMTYFNVIFGYDGYGHKTSDNAGYVAVVEAWGNFIGGTFNEKKYRLLDANIANDQLFFLENQMRNDDIAIGFNSTTIMWEGWIPWGMLHDMIDVGEPFSTAIDDQATGYTMADIFKGFHQGSTDIWKLEEAILANNNNYQVSYVQALRISYGWSR